MSVRRKWLPDEETQLRQELKLDLFVEDIAASHDRSVGAIKNMARLMGYTKLKSKQPVIYSKRKSK